MIGFMAGAAPGPLVQRQVVDPFLQGLRDIGYVEGQNITVLFRWAEGKPERFPDLANELVRLDVDVIVAAGPASALAAKNATSTIPVVFTMVSDAVAEGLVASLGRPGKNLTGLSISAGVEIVGKRLQLLKEAVPSAKRIGLLTNPGNPSHVLVLRELTRIAQSMSVELQVLEARRSEDFAGLFMAMTKGRVDALLVLDDAMFAIFALTLVELSGKNRIPAIYGSNGFVEAGGLMSYQGNFLVVNRRAATYVDKILKGAKPGDLPVEEPTRFDLAINLNAAKALGITIPQTLLLRADEVIQ